MKIFLIIFFSIIFIVSLILFLPMGMCFFYNSESDQKYDIFIKVLFFKIKINSNNQDNQETKSKKNKKNKFKHIKNDIDKNSKNKTSNSEDNDEDNNKNKDIRYYYNLIREIYDILSPVTKKLLSCFKIKNIDFYHIVSGDDAAQIGIEYGKLNIAIYNIYNIVDEVFDIKKSKIFIYPDFVNDNNKSQTKITIQIGFAPIYVLLVIITLIMNLYSFKNKKQKNNK